MNIRRGVLALGLLEIGTVYGEVTQHLGSQIKTCVFKVELPDARAIVETVLEALETV